MTKTLSPSVIAGSRKLAKLLVALALCLGTMVTTLVTVDVGIAGAAVPTITSISPISGPAAGGNMVVINGTGFSSVPAKNIVQFGSGNPANVTAANPEQLTITAAPPGTGTVSLTVTAFNGTSNAVNYTYAPAPMVTGVNPNNGPQGGGNTVTVTGTGFVSGSTTVTFDSTAGSGVSVSSGTSLTVIVPAGTGTVSMTVSTTGGGSSTPLANAYTYNAPPTVTNVNPNNGPPGGGNTITVTGTGFVSGSTVVDFGATAGTGVSVSSSNTLTVVVPAGSGTVSLTVSTATGGSSTPLPTAYAYTALPATIFEYVAVGGTDTGNCQSAASPCATISYAYSQTSEIPSVTIDVGPGVFPVNLCVCVLNSSYPSNVTIQGSAGTAPATTLDGQVSVRNGQNGWLTLENVTVNGESGNAISTGGNFGFVNVVDSTVTNSQTALTTSGIGGGIFLTDSTISGNAVALTLGGIWMFNALESTIADNGAGIEGLGGNSTASFTDTILSNNDGHDCAFARNGGFVDGGYNIADDGTCDFTATTSNADTPVGLEPSGLQNNGGPTETLLPAPSSPAIGAVPTGTTLNGDQVCPRTDQRGVASVGNCTIGAVEVLSDDYSYEAGGGTGTAPASASGPDGTTITLASNPFTYPGYAFAGWNDGTAIYQPGDTYTLSSGGSPITFTAQWTAIGAPTVTAVTPNIGPASGGNTVTVSGTGFVPGSTTVSFGSCVCYDALNEGLDVNVSSDTSLTAVVPNLPFLFGPGFSTVSVTVITSEGQFTLANAYTFYYPPTVTGVSPDSGPILGGTSVTVTGTGFVSGSTTVDFGTTAGTSVDVLSDTSLTVTAPAGSGTVDITVTTLNGTSATNQPGDQYTYNATDTYSYAPGAGIGTAPAAGSGLDGTTITLAANSLTNPGYTFAGWSDGTATYQPGDTYTLASNGNPITFTAQWTENPIDNVAFNSDGGAAVTSLSSPDGSSITLPSDTRPGYTFDGWFTASTGGTEVGGPGSSLTIPSSGATLFAQWTANADCNPPVITSADSFTALAGSPTTFWVTTCSGSPPIITGSHLPVGLLLVNNSNGTATISGTPAATDGGIYSSTITATVGTGIAKRVVRQQLIITVDRAPSMALAGSRSALVGAPFSYTVKAKGYPTVAFSKSGALPQGITFTDNGNGTATLAGTPQPGSGGTYPLNFAASNSVASVSKGLVLNVHESPAITSASSDAVSLGNTFSFLVTASGFPFPSISCLGTRSKGVYFVNNHNGTASLAGTPAMTGTFTLTCTAANSSGRSIQTFTLTVS